MTSKPKSQAAAHKDATPGVHVCPTCGGQVFYDYCVPYVGATTAAPGACSSCGAHELYYTQIISGIGLAALGVACMRCGCAEPRDSTTYAQTHSQQSESP